MGFLDKAKGLLDGAGDAVKKIEDKVEKVTDIGKDSKDLLNKVKGPKKETS